MKQAGQSSTGVVAESSEGPAPEGEDASDIEIAWENLETARVIYTKHSDMVGDFRNLHLRDPSSFRAGLSFCNWRSL